MMKIIILLSFFVASLQVDNCEYSKKICKACKSGYTLVQSSDDNYPYCINTADLNALQTKFSNCIKSSEDHSDCTKCQKGFFLSNKNPNTCISKPYCNQINENDECQYCEYPYLLHQGECIKRIGCESLDEEGNCEECSEYYYLNDNKECKRIPISHCETGDSQSCEECEEGYYLNNDKKCSKVSLPHCEEGDSEECEECEYYYYLVDGQCEKISQSNCMDVYDDDADNEKKGKCSYCEDGYYLDSNNNCKKPTTIPLCKSYYYDKDKCSECQNGYYFDDESNQCIDITIGNCEYQYSAQYCGKCKEGYQLSEDSKKCEELCETFEDNCSSCKDNYETYDFGLTCTKIDPDYTPSSDKNEFISLNLVLIISIVLFTL